MSRRISRRSAIAVTATAAVAGAAAFITRQRSSAAWPLSGGELTESPPVWVGRAGDCHVRLSSTGSLLLSMGTDRFHVESFFSYPGDSIGWLSLAREPRTARVGDSSQVWTIADQSIDSVAIRSACAMYELTRRVRIDRDRIRISDVIRNTSGTDVAVLVSHQASAESPLKDLLLGGAPSRAEGSNRSAIANARRIGRRVLENARVIDHPAVTDTAENPTILLTTSSAQIGMVMEDPTSRLQATLVQSDTGASVRLEHLAVRAGEELTLQWTIHALSGTHPDTFLNRVREDWGVQVSFTGACSFFDVVGRSDLLRNTARLSAFLKRGALDTLIFTPWLDYDNFDWRQDRFLSRSEYAQLMREAKNACDEADPRVRCLGSMQSNLVTPPKEVAMSLLEGALKAAWTPGIWELSDNQMQVAERARLPFRDSLVVSRNERYVAELYESGPKRTPMVALAVHPVPGNTHSQFLSEQADFLLNTVALDGIYVDQFNLAFDGRPSQRFSHRGWDGVSVDVDPRRGTIARRYVDGALVGDPSRTELSAFALRNGRTMVVNTASATPSFQRERIVRFVEGWQGVNAMNMTLGTKPPLVRFLAKAQLGSPLALGYVPPPTFGTAPIANEEAVMKCIVTFLRHGLLYVHADAETSGALATLIGAMYPITPTAVHEGWVEGPERIVTTISGDFVRRQSQPPTIRCFGPDGSELRAAASLVRMTDGWGVKLRMVDWSQVAVIA
jgi:hypothetical protein